MPNNVPSNDSAPLRIMDSSLRDGLQGRGAVTSLDGELDIARALLDMEVDVLEAGCPSTDPEELKRIQRVVQMARGTRTQVAAFAMCRDDTIDAAERALEKSEKQGVISLLTSVSDPHIHTMFDSSDHHTKARDLFIASTERAARSGHDVHAYLEDVTQADRTFVLDLVPSLEEAGATTISVPDTNGVVNNPQWYGRLVADVKSKTREALVSAHTHNDLNLAVANALAAVEAGVDQVEGTLAGWGEGIGNMSLEEFLYALYKGPHSYNRPVRIQLEKVFPALETFIHRAGLDIGRKKPLVGMDAHATGAGIHQAKMRRNSDTYGRTNAEFLGFPSPDQRQLMVFRRSSSRNAVLHAMELEECPIADRNDPRLWHIVQQAKHIAENTEDGELPLEVIAALAMDVFDDSGRYSFTVEPNYGKDARGEYVKLHIFDRDTETTQCVEGTHTKGVIAATADLIRNFTGIALHIDANDYRPKFYAGETDALSFVRVRARNGERIYEGIGANSDQNVAGILAILRAFNRAAAHQKANSDV